MMGRLDRAEDRLPAILGPDGRALGFISALHDPDTTVVAAVVLGGAANLVAMAQHLATYREAFLPVLPGDRTEMRITIAITHGGAW